MTTHGKDSVFSMFRHVGGRRGIITNFKKVGELRLNIWKGAKEIKFWGYVSLTC